MQTERIRGAHVVMSWRFPPVCSSLPHLSIPQIASHRVAADMLDPVVDLGVCDCVVDVADYYVDKYYYVPKSLLCVSQHQNLLRFHNPH